MVVLGCLGTEVELCISLLENRAKPNNLPKVRLKFVFLCVFRISYYTYFLNFFLIQHINGKCFAD